MLNITTDINDALAILEPKGKLSEDDFIVARQYIDPLIEKVGSLKGIIIYTEEFPYWDSFGAFVKHLKFIKEHHKKVQKVAFVTNSSVIDFIEPLSKHFVQSEIRHFKFNELDQAKLWMKEESTPLETHGLSMGIKRLDNDKFFLSFKAIGKLTHEDYERIMPILDAGLAKVAEPKINVFMDVSAFKGWEARAAWDDLKLGIKYNVNFNKIALYGENKLIDSVMKVSSWFMNGTLKEFDNRQEALRWLYEDEE